MKRLLEDGSDTGLVMSSSMDRLKVGETARRMCELYVSLTLPRV